MKTLILLLCLGTSLQLLAQTPNDTSSLHQQSKKEIISSLRNQLIDNVIEQNTNQIVELTKTLSTYENDYYVALYPYEQWIISLLIKDYNGLTTALAQIDTAAIYAIPNKIRPENDGLNQILNQRLKLNSAAIIADIQSQTTLSSEDKALLLLIIKDITIREKDAQAKINDAATTYLNSFPESKYDLYVRQFVRYEYNVRGFVWGMELFAGASVLTGKISETFTNGGLLGLGFIWGIGNFQLNTRYFVGAGSMNKDATYDWQQEMGCSTISPELSLSYIFHPRRKITIAPVAGVSWFVVGPPLGIKNQNANLKGVDYASSASPIVGIDLGWEFYKNFYYNYIFHKTMAQFSSLNLRYCIQQTNYPNMPNFNGGVLQTIVLSFKMGISGAKRVY